MDLIEGDLFEVKFCIQGSVNSPKYEKFGTIMIFFKDAILGIFLIQDDI